MAKSPVETGAPAASAPAADDGDWLGYGAYAEALWSRVIQAVNKDKPGRPLGDDPLVVGIFGEWGAGKSALLKLMYRRAEAQSNLDIARRVLHAADDLTQPITVTVPVMFQPWKYEHEPHLHVPLAIHVADALEEAWKKLPTDFEHVKVFVDKAAEALKSTDKTIKAASGVFSKMKDYWQGAQKAIHSGAAKVVAGTLDVAAISVGIPPVLTLGLNSAREHVEEPEEEDEGEEAKGSKGKLKSEDKKPEPAVKTSAEKRETSFSHSDNGLAFYRIHKLMQSMTRPKLDAKQLDAAGLKIGKGIEFDLRINFVVFVDDLDRCLPEKAVETLELIKTTFNIESFAFVLALDDEVIERGIGHRYKEYQLVGKKPEMPITGFEYLEKIVHVPFRLPALTRAQATEFVRQYEREIEPDVALRWFEPVQPSATSSAEAGRAMQRPDLLELALSGFDAFMPRKLIRMVELLHQVAKIAAIRKTPLQVASSGGVDVRVVLALLLIQLFQPELHRILRRRDESFPVLLAAFADKEDGTKDGSKELYDSRVSDIDLWQWAVHAAHVGQRDAWSPPDFEKSYGHAVQQIGLTHKDSSFDRLNAQSIRLPVVVQIINHRAVNRHVFDVLKLVTALAASLGAEARRLTIRPYFSLLSQQTELSKASIELSARVQAAATATATLTATETSTEMRPRFDLRSVEDLADILLSADEAVQANLASRIDLREGEVLSASSAAELINSLAASFSTLQRLNDGSFAKSKLNLLKGLQYLAPYLAAADAKSLWQLVNYSVDFANPVEPKSRALWGDVRSLLGCDTRFELPDHPYLMKDRFNGNGPKDEPIPGFVCVPAGKFILGSKAYKDNPLRETNIFEPFYMQRCLVTVDQYALFVSSDGYDNDSWWDKQGIEWKHGIVDSRVGDRVEMEWLARRSTDFRMQPMHWDAQKLFGSRPVHGVTWFEARAYARWLNFRMRKQITGSGLLPQYQVFLPTEVQWERAARASSLTAADDRIFPWGNQMKDLEKTANLSNKMGNVCAVGLFPPNPIGLYDIAGNVWEWMDNLHRFRIESRIRTARDAELKGENLDFPALRGGSWLGLPEFARCWYRSKFLRIGWRNDIGIRVVLSLAD